MQEKLAEILECGHQNQFHFLWNCYCEHWLDKEKLLPGLREKHFPSIDDETLLEHKISLFLSRWLAGKQNLLCLPMSHFFGIYLSPQDLSIERFWSLGIKATKEATEPHLAEDGRVVTFTLALSLKNVAWPPARDILLVCRKGHPATESRILYNNGEERSWKKEWQIFWGE